MLEQIIHKWFKVPYKLHAEIMKNPIRPKATLLLLHGIGNNSHAWDAVIKKLPKNIRVIAIDLLGFGQSPKPKIIEYNAYQQARCVIRTYLSLGSPKKIIIVGHSLGALVGVELAKRYPLLVQSLILVSPPFYRAEDPSTKTLLPQPDDVLKDIYKVILKKPKEFVKLADIAMKYNLINDVFNVSDKNIESYMNTLQASIINQKSMEIAQELTLPIEIIYGKLDPIVVTKNLKSLDSIMPNVTLNSALATHELKGALISEVTKSINNLVTFGSKK